MLNCCLKIPNLTEEELVKANENFLPRKYSSFGFINNDENICDVYQNDLKILEEYNIKYDQITDCLENLVTKYNHKFKLIYESNKLESNDNEDIKKYHQEQLSKIPENIINGNCYNGFSMSSKISNMHPIIIDDKYLITRVSYWGFQHCPFSYISEIPTSRKETGGGDDFTIINLLTSKSINFNDLLIHLIRNHHFFEGNVFHRLNPLDVINFFELSD